MNGESRLNRMNENPMGTFANVVLIGCLIGLLAFGGGCSRSDKEDDALKYLIEQNRRTQDEKISQMSDRVRELNESLANLSRELKNISRQVTDIETARGQDKEGMSSQNERLEEKYSSLLERFESLSRQVAENSSSARQFEQSNPSVHFPMQPQVIAQNEPAAPVDQPQESSDDLQQKLNRNLAEIKELVKKNPACYINPKVSSIINRENKIATMKDRRYCACVNVTFVRDAFYCSGCKRVTPYRADVDYNDDYGRCRVCRQMSFYRWLEARKKVDETATINARIDELYTENESLEKQIRSLKQSRLRK